MKPALAALALISGLALAACASSRSEGVTSGYAADLDRLTSQCDARGGVLVPSARISGQVERDYVCKIDGPSTRAP